MRLTKQENLSYCCSLTNQGHRAENGYSDQQMDALLLCLPYVLAGVFRWDI